MHEYMTGSVNERINDLIIERKTTQVKLAKAIGVSEATMSRYVKGTTAIPCDVLLKIARYFQVTTDFLLGATNIPYKTNYDIDRLGLTEEAAKRLIRHDLNMDVLNKLLVSEDFAILTEQIAQYIDETNRAGMAVMNRVLQIAGNLVAKQAKTHPLDKAAAVRTYRKIKGNMVAPQLPDTAAMERTWGLILNDLKNGAAEKTKESQKLTTEVMERLIEKLESRKGTFDLHSVTIHDITGAIAEVIVESGYPEEEKEELEKNLVKMFEGCTRATGCR
ncbi:MAG: helix-turn-helix domain-containing protein [Aristaeellaceae bacterium]